MGNILEVYITLQGEFSREVDDSWTVDNAFEQARLVIMSEYAVIIKDRKLIVYDDDLSDNVSDIVEAMQTISPFLDDGYNAIPYSSFK